MSVPPNHVAQAARFLTSAPGTPKEKLVIGGKVLCAALMIAGDWTPDLLTKAKEILAALMKGGTVKKTVARMDEKTASNCLKQLAKDMTELASGIEQVRSRKRLARR